MYSDLWGYDKYIDPKTSIFLFKMTVSVTESDFIIYCK